MSPSVTLDDIRQARSDTAPFVHRTPLVDSRSFSAAVGAPAALKLENLQKTGSFKPRGALTNMIGLDPSARERGVITISAGNHAQGVAYAAACLGCRATVVMPASASRAKADAARGYGAEVVLHGNVSEAFEKMNELMQERNLALIHPFDAPETVAGQGTVGLEIMEEAPQASMVVCGIGGGGLISGVALAVKSINPKVKVVGVEPVGAAGMHRSLEQGSPACLDKMETIADGLAAPFAGKLNFEIVREHVDAIVLVTDDEIRQGMKFILERCKTLAEPAGAAATAALLTGKVRPPSGGKTIAVVSGGNIAPEMLARLMA